ncbi:MAG: LysM peptidoglycan-binding domain-containing protein [Hydrogenothermaceae bacterium]
MTLKSGIKLGIFSLFTFVSFSFAESYTVQKGDTIEKIAKKFNVSQEEIIKANNIKDPKRLREGQKIEIPTKSQESGKKAVDDRKFSKKSSSKEEIYEVKSGDTLEKIAKRYNLTVKEIMEYNDMRDERIFAGDQLKIPLSKDAISKKKLEQSRKTIDLSRCEIYTLKKGGTLKHVSKRTGIDVRTLEKYNSIDSSQWLEAGTKVCIGEKREDRALVKGECELLYKPKKRVSLLEISRQYNIPVQKIKQLNNLNKDYVLKDQEICLRSYEEVISVKDRKYTYYTVKRGDTVEKIAQKFNTTVADIRELNNLRGDKIHTGEKLKIPVKAEEQEKVVQKPVEDQEQEKPSKPILPKEIKPKMDDIEPVATNGVKLGWPVDGRVIAGFQNDENVRHLGIEIASNCGERVKATESGKVVYAGDGIKAFGNLVVIRHDNGLTTVYGYLDRLSVSEGMRVYKGESIGVVGKLKNSDTCGIYFEVRKNVTPIDPQKVLE